MRPRSVLGLLPFVIYINDLGNYVVIIVSSQFADNSNIAFIVDSEEGFLWLHQYLVQLRRKTKDSEREE